MIKTGDMVIQKWSKIRGPDGKLKQLEESPYYGIVIATNMDIPRHKKEIQGAVHRVLWFDRETGARKGDSAITIELESDLEVISNMERDGE